MKNKCMIIAEAGVNHNGDLKTALKMCDVAKEIGADVIKFQTWKTEKIITKTVKQADYQIANTGKDESQYNMLKKLELPYEDFRTIKDYCDKIGIVFNSTADDAEGLDFLVSIGISFIKIGSADIGNVPLLERAGETKLPVILSTGMSTMEDVEFAVRTLKDKGNDNITILHCTTNYPCPFDEVNLKAMQALEEKFHMPVGYSDHTKGTEVAVAAVALGASVIEKHFTLDRNMEGPDHIASTEADEFKKMITEIRNIESALGEKVKKPTKSESEISKVVTKRIVAATRIERGQKFTEENLCIKRNEAGRLAREWNLLLGMVATRAYDADEGIEES